MNSENKKRRGLFPIKISPIAILLKYNYEDIALTREIYNRQRDERGRAI